MGGAWLSHDGIIVRVGSNLYMKYNCLHGTFSLWYQRLKSYCPTFYTVFPFSFVNIGMKC